MILEEYCRHSVELVLRMQHTGSSSEYITFISRWAFSRVIIVRALLPSDVCAAPIYVIVASSSSRERHDTFLAKMLCKTLY